MTKKVEKQLQEVSTLRKETVGGGIRARKAGTNLNANVLAQLKRLDKKLKEVSKDRQSDLKEFQQMRVDLTDITIKARRDLHHVLYWVQQQSLLPRRDTFALTSSVSLSGNHDPHAPIIS